MSAYFANFGSVWYKFSDGSTSLINDITKFVTFRDIWKKDPRVQLQYQIKDGERPDSISSRLYGTPYYWWIIRLLNNISDYDEQWPRDYAQLDDYISDRYPFNSPADIHHYVSPQGHIVDLLAARIKYGSETDNDAIYQAELTPVSIIDYEMQLNELKRNIILVDPDYVQAVAAEFERLINE